MEEFRDLWQRSYGSWSPEEILTIVRFRTPRIL